MSFLVRPYTDNDLEDIVQLSLLAWEPVFSSFRQLLGSEIYTHMYPDWRTLQRAEIEKVCKDSEKTTTWVADLDGIVAGFIACILNMADKTGEVYFLAVHPEYQKRGIGTELNNFGLKMMKESGMKIAVVGTGGDPSHAPARRSYEKAGFTNAVPSIHFYKHL